MALDMTVPGFYDATSEGFTVTNGTKAKILVDMSPSYVHPANAGHIMLGGLRITDGLITSTDAADKSLVLWVGQQASAYADMGAVNTVATAGQIVINRTVGSFITDKLTVGCGVMLFGSTTAANDGLPGQVMAVTASALTVNLVGVTVVSESQAAGFRVLKLGMAQRIKVPANSGNSDTLMSVPLIGYATDARQDPGIFLGSKSVLVGAMAAAVSALPAQVGVTLHIGGY